MSFITNYHIDLIEAERSASRWEKAALALQQFIKEHSPVVGHDAVMAYGECRRLVDEATYDLDITYDV